jgi:hypothetical protein
VASYGAGGGQSGDREFWIIVHRALSAVAGGGSAQKPRQPLIEQHTHHALLTTVRHDGRGRAGAAICMDRCAAGSPWSPSVIRAARWYGSHPRAARGYGDGKRVRGSERSASVTREQSTQIRRPDSGNSAPCCAQISLSHRRHLADAGFPHE